MEDDLILALTIKVVVYFAIADAFDLSGLAACRDNRSGSRRRRSLLLLLHAFFLFTVDIIQHCSQG